MMRTRGGFTLLEIMVTLVIVAMFSSAVYAMFLRAVVDTRTVQETTAAGRLCQSILNLIERDLAGCLPASEELPHFTGGLPAGGAAGLLAEHKHGNDAGGEEDHRREGQSPVQDAQGSEHAQGGHRLLDEVGAGDAIITGRGQSHGIVNEGDEAFEAIAREMHEMTGGQNEEWPKVVTMGLSPSFLQRTVMGMSLPRAARGKTLICLFQRGAADVAYRHGAEARPGPPGTARLP